jgi:hypothetical protein
LRGWKVSHQRLGKKSGSRGEGCFAYIPEKGLSIKRKEKTYKMLILDVDMRLGWKRGMGL